MRLIFNLYVDDSLSIGGIAKKLTEMGISTSATMRGLSKQSDPCKWYRGTVHKILKNETYAGVWHFGKKAHRNGKDVNNNRENWIPVEVSAIVTREAWNQAQKRLIHNKQRSKRNNTKFQYLLRGRLTCANCGEPMSGLGKTIGHKTYLYYRCCVTQL